MSKIERKPSLRFKDFTGAWEEYEFKEIFNYERPDMFIVSTEEYSNTYSTPVLTANKGFILGYTNETRTYNKPCIIFDDFTLDSKYVDFPFMVKSSAMKILTTKQEFDLRFAYELLNSTKIENLGHARHYISVVQPALVKAPKNPEQTKISALFEKVDSLITLHQRKYDKLVNIKKSLFQTMFPIYGEEAPKLRFKGFADAWEQRELQTIYGKIRNAFVGTATPYYVESGNFYLESNNIKDGQINRNAEVFINDEFYLKQKDNWLKTGDMVMVQSGHVGHSAVIPHNLNNSAAHALIMFAEPKVLVDPDFLNYQYQTMGFKKAIDSITKGNTIKHILSSDMKEFQVLFTCIGEQNMIGEIFMKLDSLITLHQRKLEKLHHIKKSLLNLMFVS